MKKQVRYGIVIASAALVLILIATSALAFPSQNGACTASGCHDSSTGMTISASETTINVEPDTAFSVNIQVQGVSGQNALLLKFPSGVADNALFDYGSLGAEGAVDDGDAADKDADTDQIEVDYGITAPTAPGSYTLHAFAAQHTPNAISVEITVVVTAPAGPGPAFALINGTPKVPLDTETVSLTANITSEVDISEVTLQYSTDNRSTWTNQTMTSSNGLYIGTIPAFPLDTHVVYRIVAVDIDGEESISWDSEYIVSLPPAEPLPQLHYGWLLGAPAILLAYIGTAMEYYDEEKYTRVHGIMLSLAYILTSINVGWLFLEDPSVWNVMNPANLINLSSTILFIHSWHVWLGIISMVLGTLAFLTHIAGWKTCNLGLPAVVIWTILGFTGMYLGVFFTG
ncbi:MAG: hypothetical protein P1Q69_18165 [Candidatus Thorarchaeota archaeon]|nr:hypothetical protein [Candidatus Thorarchaeota archaeon]